MLNRILETFRLKDEKEDFQIVIDKIATDVVFKGTNLLILVFAIFIASLGLNMNSTAVIIGAMLISPLMGPIIGMGLGVGINDFTLVRKAIKNFTFAVIVSLITSTLYFTITPIQDAHSELLARTFPTIYDVLIALFGGFAGIVAMSSKLKGNVIPGVAIATALMPPLCTAGYGLATFNMNYFFGAFYLFTINTVFIALATLLIVRLLKFPIKQLENTKANLHSKRLVAIIPILTLIPSIYFGYEMVIQSRFTNQANLFVDTNSSIEGNYLIDKKIDPLSKKITLIFGGIGIKEKEIEKIKGKLKFYNLQDANLLIKQGFDVLNQEKESSRIIQLTQTLGEKNKELNLLKSVIDTLKNEEVLSDQIFKEIRVQHPEVIALILKTSEMISMNERKEIIIILIKSKTQLPISKQKLISDWLKVRLTTLKEIKIIFER